MGVAQWIKWAVWKRLGSGTKDHHCNAPCLSALRWLLHDRKDSRICQSQKCWKQWDLQLHSEGSQAHYRWVGSVYSRRTWFSIIYKVCQNFVWLKERCCTCAKIFYEYSWFVGLTGSYCLAVTEANRCSEFRLPNAQSKVYWINCIHTLVRVCL